MVQHCRDTDNDTVSTSQVSSVQLMTDKKLEAFNKAQPRPGVGNPWHACRTWHASTSIRHASEDSETRSFLKLITKSRSFITWNSVSVSFFSFANNLLSNLTLCVLLMQYNYKEIHYDVVT